MGEEERERERDGKERRREGQEGGRSVKGEVAEMKEGRNGR